MLDFENQASFFLCVFIIRMLIRFQQVLSPPSLAARADPGDLQKPYVQCDANHQY